MAELSNPHNVEGENPEQPVVDTDEDDEDDVDVAGGGLPVLKWSKGGFKTLITTVQMADEWDATYPQEGDTGANAPAGYITLWADFFNDGNLRLPVTVFVAEVLEYYHLHISQLSSFGMFRIRNFEYTFRAHGLPITVENFRRFYQLTVNTGFFSFTQRHGSLKLMTPPKGVTGWKKKFFYVKACAVYASMSFRNVNVGVSDEDIPVATAKTVDWFSRLRPIELKKLDNNQLWVLRMMLTRPDRKARPVLREKSVDAVALWKMFEPDFEGRVELIAVELKEGFNLEILSNFCVPTRGLGVSTNPSSSYHRKNETYQSPSVEAPFDSYLPFLPPFNRTMASHIVGYPRMGPKRELKFALESFWDGKSTAEDLQKVAADLRSSIWKQMSDAGIKYIPSNTFSYYDQVLDTTAMLGAVPSRYNWNGGEIGFDTYFSMARGNASVPAMEMTKWFDTNYHFIVPELGPDVKFTYASHKAVTEYKEAKALGVDTVPVFVGPVSYLLLSKPAKGVEKTFDLLSLLDKILPIYKEVIAELKEAGATWIQFDEATLVKDLEAYQLEAFTKAYAELESACSGLNVLVATYFADVPAEAYKTLTSLPGVTGYTFDLIRGEKTLGLIKSSFPSGKYLFAGVVDGRNIWANDLAGSLAVLESLEAVVGKDKLVVSTSCSLLHTAVDLVNETKLDDEIKSWLAFAAQKVVEVNALAKALAGKKDEAYFAANAAAQASRKSSPRVTNEAVQKAAAALRGSDHRRATNVSARLDAQQKKLNLPILPTTTIGSFPQTIELRRVRREYKAKKISEEEYVKAIKEEIYKVVQLQEELDIDVLVHGEPERNDMVEYFGEQLSGFAFTANGWVQSYGSRCVKPPIIYGDVSRPKAMTVFWSSMAQEMTKRPMKGMLTGPVTILNWSFVRNDQPRFETCYQIALAIKDEVEDLEKAGITVIQIDEAALREGLPLRKAEHAFYLDWAVHSFRITNVGVADTTQIHTHMCYSNFNDIIHSIINMDADVITIENSRSDEKLLSVFREGVKYGAGIGPGVYDIHSPRIPSMEEIHDRINKMLAVLETNILWVNPDCGLKTRKYAEVKPALLNMVAAAKKLRAELASAK
ncbi:putative 5-methyltetrahydropteroyltriglutamate--homocysteine S-methyltransferase [Helianthus annuus]|nr:putative 5-methyltetrahydropteroyltriglutamate--homocysteine S-methyltransferase [Helianthus annuus]